MEFVSPEMLFFFKKKKETRAENLVNTWMIDLQWINKETGSNLELLGELWLHGYKLSPSPEKE